MADERRRWIWERHRGGTAAVEEREIVYEYHCAGAKYGPYTEQVDPAVQFSGRFLHLRYHINKDIHPSEIQRKWYGSEIRPRTLPSLLHYAMQVYRLTRRSYCVVGHGVLLCRRTWVFRHT
jgi:hypothetical protein